MRFEIEYPSPIKRSDITIAITAAILGCTGLLLMSALGHIVPCGDVTGSLAVVFILSVMMGGGAIYSFIMWGHPLYRLTDTFPMLKQYLEEAYGVPLEVSKKDFENLFLNGCDNVAIKTELIKECNSCWLLEYPLVMTGTYKEKQHAVVYDVVLWKRVKTDAGQKIFEELRPFSCAQ